jgi:hypothetical protein
MRRGFSFPAFESGTGDCIKLAPDEAAWETGARHACRQDQLVGWVIFTLPVTPGRTGPPTGHAHRASPLRIQSANPPNPYAVLPEVVEIVLVEKPHQQASPDDGADLSQA